MDELEEVFNESEETEKTSETEEIKGEESEPPSEPKEPTLVPVAALQDERRKTRAAKEELERLKKLLPQDEEPDPFEDAEKWKEYQRQKIEEELQQREQQKLSEKIETSRNQMLESYSDYIDIETIFTAMSLKDSALADEMIMSPDPAKFAYEKGKEYLTDLQKQQIKEQIEPEVPAPSLATKTAPSTSVHVEKDEDFKDMFKDQPY